MSTKLGPIHHWLYNKIDLQNKLCNKLIDKYELQIPKIELPPISNIIDNTDIHGWLQNKIDIVERHMCHIITYCLEEVTSLENLKYDFKEYGKTYVTCKMTPLEFYKAITDNILDGMPCDHVNSIVESTENYLIYKKNICVHKKYWDEEEADINIYYNLLSSLIYGMAENAKIIFRQEQDYTFKIMEV